MIELGCGGGLNQQFYEAGRISAFAGIDPHEKLLEGARARASAHGWDVDIGAGVAEDLPFATGSFDTVVCTYTLCSAGIPNAYSPRSAACWPRVERLLFLEHGRARDQAVALAGRIEPVWKPLAGASSPSDPTRRRRSARGGLRGRDLWGRPISDGLPRLWAGWNGAWPARPEGRPAPMDQPTPLRCQFRLFVAESALPPAALWLGRFGRRFRALFHQRCGAGLGNRRFFRSFRRGCFPSLFGDLAYRFGVGLLLARRAFLGSGLGFGLGCAGRIAVTARTLPLRSSSCEAHASSVWAFSSVSPSAGVSVAGTSRSAAAFFLAERASSASHFLRCQPPLRRPFG